MIETIAIVGVGIVTMLGVVAWCILEAGIQLEQVVKELKGKP